MKDAMAHGLGLNAAALCLFYGSRQPGLPTGDKFFRPEDYRWQPVAHDIRGDEPMDDPLRDERIRKAVERNLSAMGFREVTEDRPDFFIDCSIFRLPGQRTQRCQRRSGHRNLGRTPRNLRRNRRRHGKGSLHPQEGMLHIDVIDPQSGIFYGAEKEPIKLKSIGIHKPKPKKSMNWSARCWPNFHHQTALSVNEALRQ